MRLYDLTTDNICTPPPPTPRHPHPQPMFHGIVNHVLWQIIKLTVILSSSSFSFAFAATSAKSLVTAEDEPAWIEKAAEEIDDYEDKEYDSNHNASNGSCSKLFKGLQNAYKHKNEPIKTTVLLRSESIFGKEPSIF